MARKIWGFVRCKSCWAFSRAHCRRCEHCRCHFPRNRWEFVLSV